MTPPDLTPEQVIAEALKLPRYVTVVQHPDGWTPDADHSPPVMHEAILVADVRDLLARTSHPDDEAATTAPGRLITDAPESAAISHAEEAR